MSTFFVARHARAVLVTLVAAVVAAVPTMASPAVARSHQPVAPQASATTYYNTYYKVISHSRRTNYIDKAHRLGSCSNPGGSCTITVSRATTRSIGLSLGASRGFVAGELNISAAKTVSVATSCHRKTPRGYVYSGYPLGSLHTYKVRRTVKAVYSPYRTATKTGTTTSGWLHAFNPYKNGLACVLEKK